MHKSTIGISFRQNVPSGIIKLNSKNKHCHFIGKAREGGAFCVPKDNINCPLARFYLGIERPDLKDLSGILVSWDDALSQDTGMNYLESAIRLERIEEYIVYFSYPHKDVEPDVIIKLASPDQLQIIIHKFSSLTGKRIDASLSGIGAACGECTAFPIATRRPNVSVGCYGSRGEMNLKQEELLLAAPFGSKIVEFV